MDYRIINRLILKYEHSLGHCTWCGQRGVIGNELKIIDAIDQEVEHTTSLKLVIRCADAQACLRRREN